MILNPYAIVIDVYAALGGKQPGATSYNDHKAYINANGQAAYMNALEGMFATQTNATMSATILGNLGLASVFTAAQGEAYLAANAGNRVKAALDLASALTNYVSDATNTNDAAILAAKTTYVATTANAYTYASNAANTADAASSTAAVSTGQTFTLTTGTDVADHISATRGSLNSTFKFTEANDVVNASVNTLNDADILLDSSSTDEDVLNLTGGSGTFTASGIEAIKLTTPIAAVLQLDNVTGVKTVDITGTNTVTADGFAAATLQPTFNVHDITRVVTIKPNVLNGTTTAGDAETINVSVSGLSYGTTAAVQSGITIDTTTTSGALEVFNLTSAGATANDFALAFDTNESMAAMNILGSQSVQMRSASTVFSGVTVDAAANTGTVTLRLDRHGDTTASTNAANWTGVDNILLVDSTAGADAGVVGSLKSGATVTFGSSFTGANSALTFQGANYANQKDVVNVGLATTASTPVGVNLVKLDVQDVKTLNLDSKGFAASTSTTGANVLDDLVGDFTTINITGDTSLEADLNIDATATATSTTTARTVVINASAMTGTSFVNFGEIAANSKVGYSITGTINADNIVLNGTAGSVDGGAGKDTITGGAGSDTIVAGDGDDTVTTSAGVDTVTLGAGKDTVVLVAAAATTAAGAEVQTLTFATSGNSNAAQGYVFNILGEDILSVTQNTDTSPTTAEFEANLTAAINASQGAAAGRFSAADGTGVVVTFAATEGNAAAVTVRKFGEALASGGSTASAANSGIATVVQTTAGTSGDEVDVVLGDFSKDDVINYTTNLTLSAGGYYEGAVSAATQATEYGIMVITDQAYADINTLETAINTRLTDASDADMIVVYLNSALGYAEAFYDSDMDTDGVATTNSIIKFTGITTLTELAAEFSTTSFA